MIMMLLYESTHRPQMLETEEETCESEKAQKKEKVHRHPYYFSSHTCTSPISFKFSKTFTAVGHLLLAHKHLVKDACLPAVAGFIFCVAMDSVSDVVVYNLSPVFFFLACIWIMLILKKT